MVESDAHATADTGQDGGVTTGELAALKTNVAQLRDDVAELRSLIDRLYRELGVAR